MSASRSSPYCSEVKTICKMKISQVKLRREAQTSAIEAVFLVIWFQEPDYVPFIISHSLMPDELSSDIFKSGIYPVSRFLKI